LHLIQKARRSSQCYIEEVFGGDVSLEKDCSQLQPEGILQLALISMLYFMVTPYGQFEDLAKFHISRP
jgi:hypothetical protein